MDLLKEILIQALIIFLSSGIALYVLQRMIKRSNNKKYEKYIRKCIKDYLSKQEDGCKEAETKKKFYKLCGNTLSVAGNSHIQIDGTSRFLDIYKHLYNNNFVTSCTCPPRTQGGQCLLVSSIVKTILKEELEPLADLYKKKIK